MDFKSEHGKITARTIFKHEKLVPYGKSNAWVMHYTVQVIFNNKKAQFQYTSSLADYEAGKDKLSDENLMYALKYFLEDGLNYEETENFQDFCDTFGYEIWGEEPELTDRATGFNRESYRIYNECKRSKVKAERIGITTEMSYEIIEELRKDLDVDR